MPTRRFKRLSIELLEGRLPLAATRFAVIGDYGDDSPGEAAVATLVKSWNPDFVITVGDNNYDWGHAETIDPNIGKYYQEFIGNYIGTYGPGSPTNRFFPALGNHDWFAPPVPSIQPYLDYFTLPGAGFANSSGNERYYEFRWGDLHFFSLDSDHHEPDGILADSTQAAWLQGALAASTARWQIVYMHHPPYSSGGIYFDDPDLQWPFREWGADAVLTGHNHIYERLVIDGMTYIVNGLGGRSRYTIAPPARAGSQIRFNAEFGAQLVTADDVGLTFEFFSVDNLAQGGTLIDRTILPANQVVGRHVYYRDSAFAGAGAVQTAIAPDKTPLLAGQTATFANYTSYDRGLNGVVIDLSGPTANLTAADFEFRRGNVNDVASWTAAAPPETILTQLGGGPNGSTRVVLGWSDAAAVRDGWLQVTVRANAATGLGQSDVFYYGNVIGESGNSAADALVDLDDVFGVRSQGPMPVGLSSRYDFNRDGLVNVADEAIALVRQNVLAADVSGDDRVGLRDLIRIQQRFGQAVATVRDGDLDGDARVTARDLALLAMSLGETAPQAMIESRVRLISMPAASPPSAIKVHVNPERPVLQARGHALRTSVVRRLQQVSGHTNRRSIE
jgi:hypothetical protein